MTSTPGRTMDWAEKCSWFMSWVAPIAWLSALATFGIFVFYPEVKTDERGNSRLWFIGASLLIAFGAHMFLAIQSFFSSRFAKQERWSLMGRLWGGGGYSYWRSLMRRHLSEEGRVKKDRPGTA